MFKKIWYAYFTLGTYTNMDMYNNLGILKLSGKWIDIHRLLHLKDKKKTFKGIHIFKSYN